MEENFDPVRSLARDKVASPKDLGEATSNGIDKTKLILPGAILLAAILISGSLLYVNSAKLPAGQANIGDNPKPNAQVSVGDSPVLGNKDAKITIVEFADFRCPFCERFYQGAERQIILDYVNTGKAKFVFKNYAFLGQESVWAGEAAECANEQGKFWEFHDWLYNNQAPESNLAYYSKTNLIKYAGQVGLDPGKFSSCLNSDKYATKVANELKEGQAAGVTGTPTLFINGQSIVGAQPFSAFKAVLDAIK